MTILGIDFGTTNTCISYYQNNQVHIISNSYGSLTTPSCLYFDIHSSEILYGNIAYNLLQSKNNNRYLSNIIHNFKRLLGITYQHYINSQQLQLFFKNKHMNVIKDPFSDFCCIQFVHNNKETIFNIIEFTSIFLKFISLEAKSYLHLDTINIDIVITVPAYFSNIQWDKFGGRVLANVAIEENNLAEELINRRYARAYNGGKKKSWCGK